MSETIVEYETKGDDLTILERCQNLKIITPEDFARSAEDYSVIDNHIKEIKAYWEKPKEDAHQTHKSICDKEKEAIKPWVIAKSKIAEERNNYQLEEKRIRLEAQRRAEAIEAERVEKERKRLLEQAIKLEEKGKTEQAEAKLEQAENVYVEPVFVPSAVEKKVELSFGGSLSSRQDFDVIVTDIKAICKAVADCKLPIGIIEIKNSALKTFAKLQQLKNGDIEGLTIKTTFRDINRK
jgi:hypothetical protein